MEAMPLAARGNPHCRRCKDYQERMDRAIRLLNMGDDWNAISLADEAEQEAEGHICPKMANQNAMLGKRGSWLSVSVWKGIYDPVLGEYRLPLARADCLFHPDGAKHRDGTNDCFKVVETPATSPLQDQHEGRIAQTYLSRLERDEIERLFADLTEADRRIEIDAADLEATA